MVICSVVQALGTLEYAVISYSLDSKAPVLALEHIVISYQTFFLTI